MICIWSSWCYCHPIISCSSKIQNGLPFWCRLTQVVLEKTPLNGHDSSSSLIVTLFQELSLVVRRCWIHILVSSQRRQNQSRLIVKALCGSLTWILASVQDNCDCCLGNECSVVRVRAVYAVNVKLTVNRGRLKLEKQIFQQNYNYTNKTITGIKTQTIKQHNKYYTLWLAHLNHIMFNLHLNSRDTGCIQHSSVECRLSVASLWTMKLIVKLQQFLFRNLSENRYISMDSFFKMNSVQFIIL